MPGYHKSDYTNLQMPGAHSLGHQHGFYALKKLKNATSDKIKDQRLSTEVLIIGAGIAGCSAALKLADKGIHVTLISGSKEDEDGNSWLAQGGIIYKAQEGDPELLEQDILKAGHDHNNLEAVHFLAHNGPKVTEELLMQRVKIPFATLGGSNHEGEWDLAREEDGAPLGNHEGEWDLTREGGHAAPRILHCADHTGKSIMRGLTKAVQESANIRWLHNHSAVDLLTSHHHTSGMTYRYSLTNTCCGAYVLNDETNTVLTIIADYTVLATGGAGQLYLHTTNHPSLVGSGISMASRAGVRLENLEYVQFHPTSFFHPNSPRFLISEAMRGEGAILRDAKGHRFMEKYDSRLDLAPRDVVSQAIVTELLASGEPCVYLDASGIKHSVKDRFPTIYAHCKKFDIDITNEMIPVVPAAHYFCGGVLTDTNGRTTLDRLYSVGECSCTGLHGANRLASTSLLEGLVWGSSAADDIAEKLTKEHRLSKNLCNAINDWQDPGYDGNEDQALIAQDWISIRYTMWNYVGIVKTQARLYRAFEEIRDLSSHLHNFYNSTNLSKPLLDLFQGCQAAYTIIQSALRNSVSLGCHRIDK